MSDVAAPVNHGWSRSPPMSLSGCGQAYTAGFPSGIGPAQLLHASTPYAGPYPAGIPCLSGQRITGPAAEPAGPLKSLMGCGAAGSSHAAFFPPTSLLQVVMLGLHGDLPMRLQWFILRLDMGRTGFRLHMRRLRRWFYMGRIRRRLHMGRRNGLHIMVVGRNGLHIMVVGRRRRTVVVMMMRRIVTVIHNDASGGGHGKGAGKKQGHHAA